MLSNDIGLVSLFHGPAQFYYHVYKLKIESCLQAFVTIPLIYLLLLLLSKLSYVLSFFCYASAITHLYEHAYAQKSKLVSSLECMCAY